jgi:hypothetical protein
MRAVHGTGLADHAAGERRSGGRRRPLVAALLGLALFCCLLGFATTALAAAPRSSAQTFLARLALQQALLTAADAAYHDYFGTSVALSGEMALVGAPWHDAAGKADAGAAYVFVRSGGAWTQQARLTVADASAFDQFGAAVALSAGTALVGAPGRDVVGASNAGAAYVFTGSGGSWTQEAELIVAGASAFDQLGAAVALSAGTALVGAPGRDAAGQAAAGAVYVFTGAGGSWTREAELTAADAVSADGFGAAVALSGKVALVGAPYHDTAGKPNAGAAYVFTGSGGSWTQEAEPIAAAGAAFDQFGTSVALSAGTALVGAPGRDAAGQVDAGAAYVFTRSGVAWAQEALLSAAGGAAYDSFGDSVALSPEAALVGAPYRDVAGKASAGAAYVFSRFAGSWIQQPRLTVADDPAADDGFGDAVALSAGTALAGVPGRNATGKADAGAASVFLLPPRIAKLSPAASKRGALVTITGTSFGATRGAGCVYLGAAKGTKYRSWSDTQIVCAVPAKARYGAVRVAVKTAAGTSNALTLTVKR